MVAVANIPIRWLALGAGFVIAAVGCITFVGQAPRSAAAPQIVSAADLGAATPATALVFVSGAVIHPGLYPLSVDARVADAVAAAGGFAPGADGSRLPNLAARIHDGRQVNVPYVKASAGGAAAAKLDVNTASVDELNAVPGMPAGLAQAIVDLRSAWGPITSMSELRTALGVDSATVTAISRSLRVVP